MFARAFAYQSSKKATQRLKRNKQTSNQPYAPCSNARAEASSTLSVLFAPRNLTCDKYRKSTPFTPFCKDAFGLVFSFCLSPTPNILKNFRWSNVETDTFLLPLIVWSPFRTSYHAVVNVRFSKVSVLLSVVSRSMLVISHTHTQRWASKRAISGLIHTVYACIHLTNRFRVFILIFMLFGFCSAFILSFFVLNCNLVLSFCF